MSRLGDHSLDRALNESWPHDASTTPDRKHIPLVGRVVWRRAGEESVEGYATRWSGRSVFTELRLLRSSFVLLTRPLSNPTSQGTAFVNKLNRLGSERERSLLSPQSLVPPVGLELRCTP
jgi:hypothetical protein